MLTVKIMNHQVSIYGFSIMSETSTGQRDFGGYEFNFGLAIKICKGLHHL